MKALLAIVACLLIALGLAIVADDLDTILRYGFDTNDVAGFTNTGEPVDWPTGERPLFALPPAYAYGIGFCGLAAALLLIRSTLGNHYCARVLRGTE